MRKKKNFLIYLLICILFVPNMVYAQNTRETNYIYNAFDRAVESMPFFEFYETLGQESLGDIRLSSMDDVFVADDRIYIVDSVESRLHVFDEDLDLIEPSVKLVRTKDGKIAIDPDTNQQVQLKSPEGIFVHSQEKEVYIADTGNERIVVLHEDDLTLKRIIKSPANMIGSTVFKPSKIVVDRLNRIFVVVQSGSEGIIELTAEGEFKRFFGVNPPKVNIIDQKWKEMASEEQQKNMAKTLAPAFNNINIDEDGFVYATTYDAAAQEKVFRFNPGGANVLRIASRFGVSGDINSSPSAKGITMSKFVDIALTDYGTYALLDRENGRIFIYSFDGELMNIFGGKGFMKGQLSQPTGIDWLGDKLIVTDKQMKKAYVYKPTEFGTLALQASEAYYNGQWDRSSELLLQALELNGNYQIAYNLIGKSHLMKDEYEEAMYYFELGVDPKGYSGGFEGYRGEWLQDNFIYVFIVMVAAIAWIIYSEYRYFAKKKV